MRTNPDLWINDESSDEIGQNLALILHTPAISPSCGINSFTPRGKFANFPYNISRFSTFTLFDYNQQALQSNSIAIDSRMLKNYKELHDYSISPSKK